MKPNDEAYKAAIAEGKRWKVGEKFPRWKVLRQDENQYGYDVIAEFNNREDRDEALERLRAEAMVDAAYAAQFKSKDYAGLIKRLKNLACELASVNDAIGEKFVEINEAADAIETLLAEREAWKGRQEATAAPDLYAATDWDWLIELENEALDDDQGGDNDFPIKLTVGQIRALMRARRKARGE